MAADGSFDRHDLVAGARGALQVFVSVALGDPALGRIEKRVELAGFVAVLDVAGQLAQDRVEMLLGVVRREVLGSGAGAVAGPPDDRAAGASTAGVAHMRGTKALGGS